MDNTVIALPLIPELEHSSYVYTFDYGGSVLKLIYKKKTQNGDQLYLTSISAGEHEKLFEIISTLAKSNVKELVVTGVGNTFNLALLQNKLNVKLKLVPEFDCFAKAFKVLSTNVSYADMFCEIPAQSITHAVNVCRGFLSMMQAGMSSDGSVSFTDDQGSGGFSTELMNDPADVIVARYNTNNPDVRQLFPCLVVMCGSSFTTFKLIDSDSNAVLCQFSKWGGRTLLGLGSVLTGAQSYDELMELAEKGDNSQVDAYIRSLKSADDEVDEFYSAFPDDGLAFCFSHAYQKSISDFKREDLAAAVVQLLCENAAQFALHVARMNDVKNVVICGSFINHEKVKERLSRAFLEQALILPKSEQVKIHLCTLGTYLGAIGAWIMGKEAEVKNPQWQEAAM